MKTEFEELQNKTNSLFSSMAADMDLNEDDFDAAELKAYKDSLHRLLKSV
jgi:hypothetical protein